MHYYKKNIGDYAKKTGRLTMLQHGAYTLLIDSCYDRERFPTMEEAIEWTWASSTEEIEAVKFVLSRFFTLDSENQYVQDRILQELLEYHSKADKNKQIAIQREANRRLNSTNRAQTVDESPPNHKPITNKPLTTNHIKDIAPPEGVASDLWKDYLKIRNKQKKPITETAIKGLVRESEKAKISLSEAIQICAERGWVGFKAEWIAESKTASPSKSQEWRTNDGLMMAKAQELGLHTQGLQRYELIQKIDNTLRSRGL